MSSNPSLVPQLHVNIPSATTSFKRSFEQFGFDLDDSPTSTSNPSSQVTDSINGSRAQGPHALHQHQGYGSSSLAGTAAGTPEAGSSRHSNDRHKRARSSSSGTGSSSSGSSGTSMPEASSSSSTRTSLSSSSAMVETQPDRTSTNLQPPRSSIEHPPRLPTPDLDVDMPAVENLEGSSPLGQHAAVSSPLPNSPNQDDSNHETYHLALQSLASPPVIPPLTLEPQVATWEQISSSSSQPPRIHIDLPREPLTPLLPPEEENANTAQTRPTSTPSLLSLYSQQPPTLPPIPSSHLFLDEHHSAPSPRLVDHALPSPSLHELRQWIDEATGPAGDSDDSSISGLTRSDDADQRPSTSQSRSRPASPGPPSHLSFQRLHESWQEFTSRMWRETGVEEDALDRMGHHRSDTPPIQTGAAAADEDSSTLPSMRSVMPALNDSPSRRRRQMLREREDIAALLAERVPSPLPSLPPLSVRLGERMRMDGPVMGRYMSGQGSMEHATQQGVGEGPGHPTRRSLSLQLVRNLRRSIFEDHDEDVAARDDNDSDLFMPLTRAPSRFSSLSNAATAGSSVSSTSSVQPSSSTLHQRRSYYRPLEVDLGSNEDTLMPMVDSPSTHPFDARPNIPSPFNRNPQRNSVDSLSSDDSDSLASAMRPNPFTGSGVHLQRSTTMQRAFGTPSLDLPSFDHGIHVQHSYPRHPAVSFRSSSSLVAETQAELRNREFSTFLGISSSQANSATTSSMAATPATSSNPQSGGFSQEHGFGTRTSPSRSNTLGFQTTQTSSDPHANTQASPQRRERTHTFDFLTTFTLDSPSVDYTPMLVDDDPSRPWLSQHIFGNRPGHDAEGPRTTRPSLPRVQSRNLGSSSPRRPMSRRDASGNPELYSSSSSTYEAPPSSNGPQTRTTLPEARGSFISPRVRFPSFDFGEGSSSSSENSTNNSPRLDTMPLPTLPSSRLARFLPEPTLPSPYLDVDTVLSSTTQHQSSGQAPNDPASNIRSAPRLDSSIPRPDLTFGDFNMGTERSSFHADWMGRFEGGQERERGVGSLGSSMDQGQPGMQGGRSETLPSARSDASSDWMSRTYRSSFTPSYQRNSLTHGPPEPPATTPNSSTAQTRNHDSISTPFGRLDRPRSDTINPSESGFSSMFSPGPYQNTMRMLELQRMAEMQERMAFERAERHEELFRTLPRPSPQTRGSSSAARSSTGAFGSTSAWAPANPASTSSSSNSNPLPIPAASSRTTRTGSLLSYLHARQGSGGHPHDARYARASQAERQNAGSSLTSSSSSGINGGLRSSRVHSELDLDSIERRVLGRASARPTRASGSSTTALEDSEHRPFGARPSSQSSRRDRPFNQAIDALRGPTMTPRARMERLHHHHGSGETLSSNTQDRRYASREARRRMSMFASSGDFMRDEDFDQSYEGLLRLSSIVGEAKPKNTPPQVINSLEQALYKDWATEESDKRCPICLDDYNPTDSVMKLKNCSHWLHSDCLKQWLGSANTCPVCRNKVHDTNAASSSHRRPGEPMTTAQRARYLASLTARRNAVQRRIELERRMGSGNESSPGSSPISTRLVNPPTPQFPQPPPTRRLDDFEDEETRELFMELDDFDFARDW